MEQKKLFTPLQEAPHYCNMRRPTPEYLEELRALRKQLHELPEGGLQKMTILEKQNRRLAIKICDQEIERVEKSLRAEG